MSFSGEVKEELLSLVPSARHCQIAEIAAFVYLLRGEKFPGNGNKGELSFLVESDGIASLLFTLFQKAYNIILVAERAEGKRAGRGGLTRLRVPDRSRAEAVRQSIGHSSLLRLDCCRRAFLRGAFLAAGSVSDPEKSYHLEIICPAEDTAVLVRDAMQALGFDGKIVLRKKDHIVYLKEGDQIVTLLGEMGGSISFLNIESVRVMKEMRERVNRRVNCETANLNKTIVSAVRQIEDIRYIKEHGGFGELPDSLREMAEVRLHFPDAPLTELGRYLDPVIGKSGVNHRLRKLSGIAARMRGEEI